MPKAGHYTIGYVAKVLGVSTDILRRKVKMDIMFKGVFPPVAPPCVIAEYGPYNWRYEFPKAAFDKWLHERDLLRQRLRKPKLRWLEG
jgi:hypothetical protein